MATSFGTVRELKSGRFQIRYQVDGVRYNGDKTFRNRSEARRHLAHIQADLDRGAWTSPTAGVTAFAQYAADWLSDHPSLRPSTRDDYARILRVHLVPAFGAMPIGRITPESVRRWYSVASTKAPARAAKSYRLLRAILGTAVQDERIPKNPCRLRSAGKDRAPERPLPSIAEVHALADAMPPHLSLMVELAAWCGFRRGELMALRRKDIDLLHGVIRIERAAYQLASGDIVVGPPKSEAGKRTVHYPSTLAERLGQHLMLQVAPDGEALVFTGLRGGPLRPNSLYAAWNAARKEVGVTCRFHDLRHCGATLAAVAGATTKELMRRLGHSSPAAALQYQHASDERDRDIAAALAELPNRARIQRLPDSDAANK